ncbi:hypothetical protein POTOM_024897 [Populus tomentosa]|uniref:NFD4 C-terminal domain-containing protein n=1 Tax=Populus tomentosa TaxID=118781 RepID=A0A8X7ZK89_POPTO|nr:hypothetical protein POTOM_024897 [Populus tomentosa]
MIFQSQSQFFPPATVRITVHTTTTVNGVSPVFTSLIENCSRRLSASVLTAHGVSQPRSLGAHCSRHLSASEPRSLGAHCSWRLSASVLTAQNRVQFGDFRCRCVEFADMWVIDKLKFMGHYYTIISATQLYMELGMKETAEFMMGLAPEAQDKSWEIRMADFWLLFFVYFVGVGSGVTVLNNLAQIGIAQGVHDTTILLSLFSFCNFVGRLGGDIDARRRRKHMHKKHSSCSAKMSYECYLSYFHELLSLAHPQISSKTIPRTIWMTCTQVMMIITYLLFASAIDGILYAATALLGICYGVQFSIMIPTVSELFGLKHFGLFYNFMSLGNPLGAFLFSGLLAGYVYDNEAAKQQVPNLLSSSSISCLGPNCFRLTFLVLAGACGLGSILSIILTMRIRPVYEMLYAGGSFRLPQTSNH